MSWSTPRTWVTGELVTAAIMNQYVRDEFNAVGLQHGCRATRSADKSINNSAHTAVDWNTEDFDSDVFHDTSTSNSKLTVPTGMAGTYDLICLATYAANATGFRRNGLRKNTVATYEIDKNGEATVGNSIWNVQEVVLGVGDWWELFAFQNSGGALNLVCTGTAASFLFLGWRGA